MKKVWLLVVLLTGSLVLAGCLNPNVPTEETNVPTEAVEQTATVMVYNIDNDLIFNQDVVFTNQDTRSTIEILEDQIEFIYQVFDFGVFVYGVGGFFPTEYGASFNYYLSLYVDDVTSVVGIDEVVLEDGMVISFKEKTMLDQTDQDVDRLIYSFMSNHLSTYVNDTYIHHDVLAAILKLALMGYDTPLLSELVDSAALDTYLESLDTTLIGQTFKKAIIEIAFGKDILDTKTKLEAFTPSNVYDAANLLNALFVVKSESELVGQLQDQLLENTPGTMDPDYAGMVMVALAPHLESHELIDQLIAYIKTEQSNTGMVSWGSANAASTATTILGLVAQGENPRDLAFTVDGVDLIQSLLLYEHNGAFKWLLANESADMNFSTPQAFAALVAYKLYRDIWENPPVYLYDLIDLSNA